MNCTRCARAGIRVLLAAAGLLSMSALPGCNKAQSKTIKETAPVVIVAKPELTTITDSEDFTGRTEALRTVEVRARVTGYLEKLYFEDGSEVQEGSQLFEIDPRPYQADLDRAAATLAQAEAHAKRLEADHERASKVFSRGALSREEYDRVSGDLAEAQATVDIAKANLKMARLNLSYTRVTAPISGRISRRLVDPGNMVKADETALTTIVTLDPMYVYFDMDERTLLKLRRLVREGKIKTRSEAEVPVRVALADETEFPHQGAIDFSDNVVDPSTGTLKVRGIIPNPTPRVLSPGLFVRVRLLIGKPHELLGVPDQAIGTDQGRKFVYVVNDKNEVVERPVVAGALADNGLRAIVEGLRPDERVIVSGLQRVRQGAKVSPRLAEEADDTPRSKSADEITKSQAARPEAAVTINNAPATHPEAPVPVGAKSAQPEAKSQGQK